MNDMFLALGLGVRISDLEFGMHRNPDNVKRRKKERKRNKNINSLPGLSWSKTQHTRFSTLAKLRRHGRLKRARNNRRLSFWQGKFGKAAS
jgi:hypothetical protein